MNDNAKPEVLVMISDRTVYLSINGGASFMCNNLFPENVRDTGWRKWLRKILKILRNDKPGLFGISEADRLWLAELGLAETYIRGSFMALTSWGFLYYDLVRQIIQLKKWRKSDKIKLTRLQQTVERLRGD
jgi:hypothetical protein